VANKGGVREEGAVGRLLAMAWETGGGPMRRGRGPHVSEGGEGKAGWDGRRPLGRLAGGPARGRGEVGCGWVKNWKWAKGQKEIPFEFQLILEIW
jgi:hypothetical protein